LAEVEGGREVASNKVSLQRNTVRKEVLNVRGSGGVAVVVMVVVVAQEREC
jgi:hypothetical protein